MFPGLFHTDLVFPLLPFLFTVEKKKKLYYPKPEIQLDGQISLDLSADSFQLDGQNNLDLSASFLEPEVQLDGQVPLDLSADFFQLDGRIHPDLSASF